METILTILAIIVGILKTIFWSIKIRKALKDKDSKKKKPTLTTKKKWVTVLLSKFIREYNRFKNSPKPPK